MRVKDLAKRLGVTADTVRYYTRIGYLEPVRNQGNGYKEFSEKDAQRLRFILSARQLGFSVEDIGLILDKADAGKTPCPLVRKLLEQRLEEAERKFAETRALLERMQAAVKEWQTTPDKMPTGNHICHLIEEFQAS